MQTMLQAGMENQGIQGCALRKLKAPHFQKHPPKVKQNAHQHLILKEIVRSNRKSTPMGFAENLSKIFSGHSETQIQIYFLSQKKTGMQS